MDENTSSADSEALFQYRHVATDLDHQLLAEAQHLRATIEDFLATRTEYNTGASTDLADDLRDYARAALEVDQWVRGVGQAFAEADRQGQATRTIRDDGTPGPVMIPAGVLDALVEMAPDGTWPSLTAASAATTAAVGADGIATRPEILDALQHDSRQDTSAASDAATAAVDTGALTARPEILDAVRRAAPNATGTLRDTLRYALRTNRQAR